MKHLKEVVAAAIIGFTLLMSVSNAQTISSKIMDANITWNGSVATAHVYLTDTIGISGIKIKVGSTPEDTTLNYLNYSIAASGNFWSNGTLTDNVLETNIGTYASHDIYLKIEVMLDNNAKHEISIAGN